MFLTNICKFKSCGTIFPTLHDLVVHIERAHVNRDPDDIQEIEETLGEEMHMSYILPYSTLYPPQLAETFASSAEIQLDESVVQQSEHQCESEMESKFNGTNSSTDVDVVTIDEKKSDLWAQEPKKDVNGCKKTNNKKVKINEVGGYYKLCHCGMFCKGDWGLSQHKRMTHKECSKTRKQPKRRANTTKVSSPIKENVSFQEDPMQSTITTKNVTIPLSTLTYQQHVRDRIIIPELPKMGQAMATYHSDKVVQKQQQHHAVGGKLPVKNTTSKPRFFNVLKGNNFCINQQK